MKDKIVIQDGTKVRTEKIYDNDIEYLRKDAIVNKLKAQQDKCVFRSTYWDFWQAVINEVNKI